MMMMMMMIIIIIIVIIMVLQGGDFFRETFSRKTYGPRNFRESVFAKVLHDKYVSAKPWELTVAKN